MCEIILNSYQYHKQRYSSLVPGIGMAAIGTGMSKVAPGQPYIDRDTGRVAVPYDTYKKLHPDTLVTKTEYYWRDMHLL